MNTYRNINANRFSSDTSNVVFAQAESVAEIMKTYAGKGGLWEQVEDACLKRFDHIFTLAGVRFYGTL